MSDEDPTLEFHHLACFSVHCKGVVVVFDPHDGHSLGFPPPQVRGADVVLCSHGHYDHNSGKSLVASRDALVLEGEPGQFEHRGVQVVGTKVRHGGGEVWGDNVVYSVRCPSGLVVVHGGDLGEVPSPAELESILSLGRPDVAILPVGGEFTVDAAGAVRTSQLLAPKLTTVACHYIYGPLAGRPDFAGMSDAHPLLTLVGAAVTPIRSARIVLRSPFSEFTLFDLSCK
ncbi:MAG: MBL fold metallo-hydrolase [Promethearchaeota archaeon]